MFVELLKHLTEFHINEELHQLDRYFAIHHTFFGKCDVKLRYL